MTHVASTGWRLSLTNARVKKALMTGQIGDKVIGHVVAKSGLEPAVAALEEEKRRHIA